MENNEPTAVHHSIIGGQQNSINVTDCNKMSHSDDMLSKKEILREIKYKKEGLSDEDIEGHIWWNTFEELINFL